MIQSPRPCPHTFLPSISYLALHSSQWTCWVAMFAPPASSRCTPHLGPDVLLYLPLPALPEGIAYQEKESNDYASQ
eukprot:scaffold105508_cov20-Tisochrysis_lutea.AAC.1